MINLNGSVTVKTPVFNGDYGSGKGGEKCKSI